MRINFRWVICMNRILVILFFVPFYLSSITITASPITIPNSSTQIHIVKGDITKRRVDAIVNAANRWIANGGGVTGAIFKAAGIQELEKMISLCPTLLDGTRCLPGNALATNACGNLLDYGIKYIIHAVGPDCRIPEENKKREELLRSVYCESLNLADTLKLKSIAFPSISTGIYSYDVNEAAPIAIDAIMQWTRDHEDSSIQHIYIVVFNESDYTIYGKILCRNF